MNVIRVRAVIEYCSACRSKMRPYCDNCGDLEVDCKCKEKKVVYLCTSSDLPTGRML